MLEGINIAKLMFGCHAQHLNCQLVFQDSGGRASDGRTVFAVVGIAVGFELTEVAKRLNSPHELVIGEMVIRPHQKYTGRNGIGAGTGHLLLNHVRPEDWDKKSFDIHSRT